MWRRGWLMHSSLVNGLAERVQLETELCGDLPTGLTAVQQFLGARDDRLGEHSGSAAGSWPIEDFDALRAIFLDTAFDAVGGHAEDAYDVCLPAGPLTDQLGGEHAKGAAVVLGMGEDGSDTEEVSPLSIVAGYTEAIIDRRGTIGNEWQ